MIFDHDMPGQRRAVGEDDAVTNPTIMGNMGLGHEQVIGPDFGEVSAWFSASVECSKFAKGVSVARQKAAPLATILEVVRGLSGGDEWKEDTTATELGRALDHAMAGHSDTIMKDYVFAYNRIRANGTVTAYFSLWADDCCGVDRQLFDFLRRARLFNGSKCCVIDFLTALDDAAVDERAGYLGFGNQ